jgi:hypothetical protein
VTLTGHKLGQQRVYMRYDRRSYSYLSAAIADNELIIEQRQAGSAPESLYVIPLDEAESGAAKRLVLTLAGAQLTVEVNDKLLLAGGEVAESLQSGGIALGAAASEANMKDDIYDAVFEAMKVEATDEAGKPEKVLYRNHYSGLDGLISRVRNAINASFNWAIDTF